MYRMSREHKFWSLRFVFENKPKRALELTAVRTAGVLDLSNTNLQPYLTVLIVTGVSEDPAASGAVQQVAASVCQTARGEVQELLLHDTAGRTPDAVTSGQSKLSRCGSKRIVVMFCRFKTNRT